MNLETWVKALESRDRHRTNSVVRQILRDLRNDPWWQRFDPTELDPLYDYIGALTKAAILYLRRMYGVNFSDEFVLDLAQTVVNDVLDRL